MAVLLRVCLCLLILPAAFSTGCTKVNLVSLPPVPQASKLPTKSDYTLYVDSVHIRGAEDVDPEPVKSLLGQHLDQARYFKGVLDYKNPEKSADGKYLIVRADITPKESHTFNWWAAWPAIYPMPFYWPWQPKKGEVSVSADCSVYTRAGELVSTYEAQDSRPYSVTFYGFFNNGDARANLKACYASVFDQLTEKITSDTRIIARTQTPPRKGAQAPRPQPQLARQPADFGRYHALVIGIDDYPGFANLGTAVNDARAVSELLRRQYGFEVTLLTNPGRADIIASLGRLRNTLTPRDNLLIYYAGHGWLDTRADEGYWLPADAQPDNEANWLSNATLTAAIRATLAKHVLIVADSCYAGKLTRAIHITRKRQGYLQRLSEQKARIALSSGGLEPVEDAGRDGHSVFAAAFIEALERNKAVLEGTQLFAQVRHAVMLSADQTPEYGDIRKAGHEGGDFLFIKN